MSRLESVMFERLGREGLALVLDDLFDHSRLVKLANACGLKYPGSRSTSQKRERLIEDLAERADENEATRLAIVRTLAKETRAPSRSWATLAPEEKARRLGDERFLSQKGNLGLHLYFLASTDGDREPAGFETLLALQQLMRLGSNGRSARASHAKPSRAETRLRKRAVEVEKKIVHLESQLAKSREAEKESKRKETQQRGELAQSRMLVERLQRELTALRAAAGPSTPSMEKVVSDLTRSVRKLATEQRKVTYRLDKLPSAPADPAPALLDAVQDPLKALHKEIAALRRETRKEAQNQLARQEQLRGELGEQLASNASAAKPRRRTAADGPQRVGVFIDVQNMHYGARQLKGKLDFDALLQAAVLERRLIQATAYVVESKEIDQSGFIALLQQRAIEVRRKTLRIRADGSMKGDWDMELALELLEAAAHLDVVVLVSGDGDFTSLVQRVKSIGPRVEVIGFPRNTAKSLVQAADRFQPLDRKFMIYPKRKPARKRSSSAKPTATARPTAGAKA